MQQSRFCQTKLRVPASGARRIFPGQAQRESRVFRAWACGASAGPFRISRPTVKHEKFLPARALNLEL